MKIGLLAGTRPSASSVASSACSKPSTAGAPSSGPQKSTGDAKQRGLVAKIDGNLLTSMEMVVK